MKKHIYISLMSLVFFIGLLILNNSTIRATSVREAENQYLEQSDLSSLKRITPENFDYEFSDSLTSSTIQHFPDWRYYKKIAEKTYKDQINFILIPNLLDLPPPDDIASA